MFGRLFGLFRRGRANALLDKRLTFLPLGPAGLDHPDLLRLARENLIVVFAPPEDANLERDTLLASLKRLRENGLMLACGQDLETRGLPEALALAQYIILDDVAGMGPTVLLERTRHLAQRYPGIATIR